MPNCNVIGCGVKRNGKHPNITLHQLPANEIKKKIWLEAIGAENLKMTTKTIHICSLHFEESCFNRTLNKITLRDDALPSPTLLPAASAVSISASPDLAASTSATPDLGASTSATLDLGASTSTTPDLAATTSATPDLSMERDNQGEIKMELDNNQVEIKVCRVCLALDVKMFDMEDFKLTEMFQNVTGISVCDEKESILHRVCWECAARLTAAAAFRNKALLSDALLKDIAHMNKSDIAQLKYIYRSSLNSPLTIQNAFTDIECGHTSPDYKEIESLTDEIHCEDDKPLVNLPMKTNSGSDPLAGNNSNIQINYTKTEIFSALTDTTEDSEVYYNNNDKVLSEDAKMTNAPINDDCYVVIVVGDEENSTKLDVVGDTVNESLSKEITQSLEEVASANKTKEMMIGKVGASCEQGNRLNDGEEQKIIASKEKGVSVAEISEETEKSLTVQNIKTKNRLNNQLTSGLSSKHFEVNLYDSYFEYEDQPIKIQDKSSPTCNVDIKDENEIFLTEDITDKNDDGVNDTGFDDPGFDDDGIGDTDVLNDKDDPSEEEYVLSDKENYSSDDSLPLEKCKEKAVKTDKKIKKIKDPTEPKIQRRGKQQQNDDFNFTFTQLTFEEQIAEIVKRQESSNYKNSFFKCTSCFKGFLDEGAYNSHMLRHTDQFGEHECKVCKIHFKLRHALKNHMLVHTQRYSCNECTYVTKTRHMARRHERWHKGTKYRCPHCQDEFNHFSTYMSHLRIKHPSDFVCEICGYSFVNAKGREQHKKLKHPLENAQIPEDGPLCELCNVRFVSSEALKRHLSVSAKHNTDKDSREPNQPKKDLTRRVLVKGKWSRIYVGSLSKADLIPCEQCGVELEDSKAYYIHFRQKHPDKNRTKYPAMKAPCMCEVCGKMLQSHFHFKDHVCVHVRERPFKCESCGKAFRTKPRLVAHQRLHSQEPPSYACTLCGKQFSNYSNRRRHMAIHTGLKPYKCEICGKGFKLPAEKRVHVTYVHLKKPWPKRTRGKRKTETGQHAASAPSTCPSPDVSMELDNQVEIKVCRVCLALDVKMFDLVDFNLNVMLKNVTGISVYDEKESILRRVCWECAARLTAAAAFRNKALLSDALLKNIAHMNKSDIAKLKHKYRSFLKSPLISRTVFTSSDIGCEDISPEHKEMEILTDETEFGNDVGSSPIAENNSSFKTKHMKSEIFPAYFDDSENAIKNSEVYNNNNVVNEVTVMTNTPLSENDSNIQIIHMNSEIFSPPTDRTENSEVYYRNNDKVLSEDDVMINAPINDDCFIVIVGDENNENSPKLEVVGDTVNESLNEEDTQTLEVASANHAKKMTIIKVKASCEQGNGLNVGEKQKIITLKEEGLSLAEISKETGKSLAVQNIETVNRWNNQLTPSLSSKHLTHILIQDNSPQTCNADIKDKYEVLLKEDITDKDDGLNGPGINDPGFYDPGFYEVEIEDTVVLNDKDDLLEEEYVLCDKEKYSSDYSVPSENCKANKTRKRKKKADKTAKRMVKVNDDLDEPFFTLTVLTLEEQIAEIMERKKSSNYKNSIFKCSMCFKGFVDEDAYNIHMSRHTDLSGEHECKICKMHFKHPNSLQRHSFLHSETYSCNQCTYVTKNRQTATLHARWHKGTKYGCPHCPDEFDQFSTYMSHLRIKHPSDFACEICGYSFVSAKGREQHKGLKHPFVNVQIPEDGPMCELCNVRFVSSEAYQRHLSVSAKHNTDSNTREPNHRKRDKPKDGDSDEKRRKYWQKVEGPIPCEQCGVELEGSWAYCSHFRRMHPDKNRTNYPNMRYPCMCELCGRMFSDSTHLKEHMLIHKGESLLTCETCGKTFKTKLYLMNHQRLHSQVRPSYECALCGKNFSNYSNRQRHLLTHTGVRPFKCEICGKGFKVPGEMRAHINYVHLKKPWPKRKREYRGSESRQGRTSTTKYSISSALLSPMGIEELNEMEYPVANRRPWRIGHENNRRRRR